MEAKAGAPPGKAGVPSFLQENCGVSSRLFTLRATAKFYTGPTIAWRQLCLYLSCSGGIEPVFKTNTLSWRGGVLATVIEMRRTGDDCFRDVEAHHWTLNSELTDHFQCFHFLPEGEGVITNHKTFDHNNRAACFINSSLRRRISYSVCKV